jgi:hypothetical protein
MFKKYFFKKYNFMPQLNLLRTYLSKVIDRVLRDGAESQCAECKGAKRQGAEPNDKLLML